MFFSFFAFCFYAFCVFAFCFFAFCFLFGQVFSTQSWTCSPHDGQPETDNIIWALLLYILFLKQKKGKNKKMLFAFCFLLFWIFAFFFFAFCLFAFLHCNLLFFGQVFSTQLFLQFAFCLDRSFRLSLGGVHLMMVSQRLTILVEHCFFIYSF